MALRSYCYHEANLLNFSLFTWANSQNLPDFSLSYSYTKPTGTFRCHQSKFKRTCLNWCYYRSPITFLCPEEQIRKNLPDCKCQAGWMLKVYSFLWVFNRDQKLWRVAYPFDYISMTKHGQSKILGGENFSNLISIYRGPVNCRFIRGREAMWRINLSKPKRSF